MLTEKPETWFTVGMTDTKVIHFQTGSSTVRCGYPMRGVFMGPADGWDLGDVTVDPTEVTCPHCLTDRKPAGVVPSTDSALTGHRCQVGRAGNHPVLASEHEDGTWSWNGFRYASFDAARTSARAAGY